MVVYYKSRDTNKVWLTPSIQDTVMSAMVGSSMKKPEKSGYPLSDQEVKDLRLVFDVFDTDSNGYIDRYELKRAMRSLGFKVTTKTVEVIS